MTNKDKVSEEHWYDSIGVWLVDGVIALFKVIYRLHVWEVRFLSWLGRSRDG